jgi:hypothetical protein
MRELAAAGFLTIHVGDAGREKRSSVADQRSQV